MDRITKRLAIALAISATLNVFFIGFAVGRRAGFRHGPRGPFGMEGPELGPRGFMRHTGMGELGGEAEKILRAHRDQLRERRRALQQARAHVRDALRSEPFDASRFSGALADLRSRTGEMQADVHGTFVEVAKTLPLPQRKRLSDAPWMLEPGGGPPLPPPADDRPSAPLPPSPPPPTP